MKNWIDKTLLRFEYEFARSCRESGKLTTYLSLALVLMFGFVVSILFFATLIYYVQV